MDNQVVWARKKWGKKGPPEGGYSLAIGHLVRWEFGGKLL